tara:strand:- start:14361 stop:15011 length:651 start_codon:yes stop_codon:yes gene_type:complete
MSKFNIEDLALTNNDVFERAIARTYDLYLHDTIEGPDKYINWNQLFRSAGPNDVIYVHINSYGGQINTAIQMMRAMRETEATIVTSIEGACLSAATMIFLCGDLCEVSDHSQFMVHTYSGGSFGKGSEIISQVTHDSEWISELMHDVYAGFFTKKEIDDIIAGVDMWVTPDDVVMRLNKRAEFLTKRAKAELKEAELEDSIVKAPKKRVKKKTNLN